VSLVIFDGGIAADTDIQITIFGSLPEKFDMSAVEQVITS